jgi:hypothetical protein
MRFTVAPVQRGHVPSLQLERGDAYAYSPRPIANPTLVTSEPPRRRPRALPIAFERFQSVARQRFNVIQTHRCIQSVKTNLRLSGKAGKLPDPFAICKSSGLSSR